MKYFDSHAHYWDARFTENEKTPDQLIGGLLSCDIAGIVNVGTSPETSRLAKEQAERFVGMEYAAGIHPTDAQGLSCGLDEAIAEIRAFFRSTDGKRPVALGEIGFVLLLGAGALYLAGRCLLPWTAPILTAWVLAALLEPAVAFLVRRRWRRGAAAGLCTLAAPS